MRTVQGAALRGLKARVRALAERTGLPVRPARRRPARPDAHRPGGGAEPDAPALRRLPGDGTPRTAGGPPPAEPRPGPPGPGTATRVRRTPAAAALRRAPAGPAVALRPAGTASPSATAPLATLAALLSRRVRPRPRRRPAGTYASATALRALRARRGDAPALLRLRSGESVLVLLDPQDLRRFYADPAGVLTADPPRSCRGADPGDPAGTGCSRGEPRAERREMTADALGADLPVHPAAGPILAALAEEARHLTAAGTLDLARARHAVHRAARRIVLGDAAADDGELAGWLAQLCAGDKGLRGGRTRAARSVEDRARARIRQYARLAGGTALVARAARHAGTTPHGEDGSGPDPADEARLWLLAMDAVPETLLRTLLLLGAHPAEQDAAAAEAAAEVAAGPARGELPRLRACVRESLRLYPVVPELVRITRTETEWRGVRHPAGTPVLLPAAFHQRDPERVPAAHVFVPGRWKNPGADQDIRMAPFGHGGGRCPGAQLGLMITAALCAEVLRTHRITDTRPSLDPVGPLPPTLDPQAVRLTLGRR
ncbi:cytochrome P450 [Streptomyces sp. NPDC091027]|uniref:cytochrome P450 n=1 Tax=Streptomyces sp. NPDC091027 TaxID=3365971 RepID=UPI003816BF05